MNSKIIDLILRKFVHDKKAHGGKSLRQTGLVVGCKRCEALRAAK